MRQAIQTKYLGPTNTKGSRIKATCAAGSLTVSYSHALDIGMNHVRAAAQLQEKLGWQDGLSMVSGQMADGTCVHVLTKAGK